MARTLLAVTQAEIDEKVAETIRSRELELVSYDFEKANHEAAITALGNLQWDAVTTPYKGLARDAMIARAIADGLTAAQIKAISDLNALEIHKTQLEAVKIETAKSERHYASALTTLPAGTRRDTAMTKVLAKVAADALK